MSITTEALIAILGEPENEHREYKRSVPDSRAAAIQLAALANSEGGILVVGVDDRLWRETPRQAVIGVEDADRTYGVLERAADQIEPRPTIDIRTHIIFGQAVVTAEVTTELQPPGPFIGPAGIRIRTPNGRSVPMSSEQLRGALRFLQHDEEEHQRRLFHQLDAMNRKLDESAAAQQETQKQLVIVDAKLEAAESRATTAESQLSELRKALEDARTAAKTRHGTTMTAIERTKQVVVRGGTIRAQWRVILFSGVVGAIFGVLATALAAGKLF